MSWVANIAYLAGAVLYLPVLLYEMLVLGKNRRGWREKLCGPGMAPPAGPKRIWVHGVSLGEINAARGVVDQLTSRYGDREVVISSTTDTGFARAQALFGAERVFRYPLDFSWTVERALRRVAPALIVLVEQEVWYNLATRAAHRGIPVCVINGRLTVRSCRRLGYLGPIARRMFAALRWVGAQDAETAGRFAEVGVPRERITVTGSVKWDTATVAERIDGQEALAAALGIDADKPLWVCGSTGPGEEALLLDAYAGLRAHCPQLQLALVPRKPERFDEVAQLIRRRDFECIRRCDHDDDHPVGAEAVDDRPHVILGDTMGELRKFYALADVVFVGRSLVPLGGSDPMEVAALGKPIVTGPHMDNFAAPVEVLTTAGALVQLGNAGEVIEHVARLLAEPAIAEQSGRAGRQAVRDNQGATERTLAALMDYVD